MLLLSLNEKNRVPKSQQIISQIRKRIEDQVLRPGEKLYEELFSADEPMIHTHHSKINIAQVALYDFETIRSRIDMILNSLSKISDTKVIEEMQEIVPGYKSKFEFIN